MPYCTTKTTKENPNGSDRFIKANCYLVLCGLANIRQESDRMTGDKRNSRLNFLLMAQNQNVR